MLVGCAAAAFLGLGPAEGLASSCVLGPLPWGSTACLCAGIPGTLGAMELETTEPGVEGVPGEAPQDHRKRMGLAGWLGSGSLGWW